MLGRLRLRVLLAASLWVAVSTQAAPQASQGASDYAAHFNRGNELMKEMRIHEAVGEFREAARLNPDHLPSQQALAVTYALTRNFPMAWKQVRLLRQANVEMPKRFLHALSAEVSEEEAVKQLQDIEKDLVNAYEKQIRGPATSAKLAEALYRAGDYAGARRETDRVLQLDPTQPDAHLLLARMLGAEPQTSAEAIVHLKTYLQWASHEPSNVKDAGLAYRMLGDIYNRGGDLPHALDTYEEGLKVAPKEAGMWNNAAWIYATAPESSLRNPEKALAYARKAVELSESKQPSFLDTLAQAFYLNGQLDQAIETEKKALSLAPDNEFMEAQLKRFLEAKQRANAPQP